MCESDIKRLDLSPALRRSMSLPICSVKCGVVCGCTFPPGEGLEHKALALLFLPRFLPAFGVYGVTCKGDQCERGRSYGSCASRLGKVMKSEAVIGQNKRGVG